MEDGGRGSGPHFSGKSQVATFFCICFHRNTGKEPLEKRLGPYVGTLT